MLKKLGVAAVSVIIIAPLLVFAQSDGFGSCTDNNYTVECLQSVVQALEQQLQQLTSNSPVPATQQEGSQIQVINSYDAYSPEPVDWDGGIRLYFGGWYTSADSPNDSIFVADCNAAGTSCSNVRKVIDPVATGWNQLNDPSIVLHPATASSPAYYIMYMTCNTQASTADPLHHDGICYSTSWANDGINWSTPVLLTNSYWLPSATWKNDHVELWANEISPGRVVMFNLGSSGVAIGTPTIVQYDNPSTIPPLYANVNVEWKPSLGIYQILAERSVGGTASSTSVIDYLTSEDGVNWHLQSPSIISAAPGQFRVGTPGQSPDNVADVYFGTTAETDSGAFKIDFVQWNPPTNSPTLTASPTSGTAPLSVSFDANGIQNNTTYNVTYGDGTSAQVQSDGNNSWYATHTYSTAGTYNATLSTGTCPSGVACPMVSLGTATVTVTVTGSQAPTATITDNGQTAITLGLGNPWNVVWSSTGGTSASSYLTVNNADTCNHVPGVQYPWKANTLSGSLSGTILPCQVGTTYTLVYTVTGPGGTTTASLTESVPPAAPTALLSNPNLANALTGLQFALQTLLGALK